MYKKIKSSFQLRTFPKISPIITILGYSSNKYVPVYIYVQLCASAATSDLSWKLLMNNIYNGVYIVIK